jgi:CDP-glucose 4,6-dehydratase
MTLARHLDRQDMAGEMFNFGTDDPKSVLEVVQTIIAVSDRPEVEPVVLNDAPNEIRAQYLNSAKAKRLLGWAPTFTLQEGLQETAAWYGKFLAGRAS